MTEIPADIAAVFDALAEPSEGMISEGMRCAGDNAVHVRHSYVGMLAAARREVLG